MSILTHKVTINLWLKCWLITYGILLAFYLLSCSNDQVTQGIRLTLSDTVFFKLDVNNTTQTKSIFYHEENGTRYLVYDDEVGNFIRVIDIDSCNKVMDIPLPVYDEGKLLFRYGFFIEKLDSIFIPIDPYKILLINSEGDLIKKIDFLELKNSFPILNNILSFSRFSKGAIGLGHYIYFLQNESRLNYQKNLLPSDYKFLFRYDFVSDSVSLMNISFPDNFWKGGIKQMSLSIAYNGKKFIYAPQYSHDIYVSDDNFRINNKFFAKSKNVNYLNDYYPSGIIPSFEEFSYKYCTSQFYIGFLWDKFRKVYYRFFWPGMDTLEAKNLEKVSQVFYNNPNFGIMVLGEDFRVLDEIILPENVYSWDKYFVAKEGLFLSADYSENQNYEKKLWTFHIFKLDTINQAEEKN